MASADHSVSEKPGWLKILNTCTEARNSRLRYAWVDTCCIDKSSSAELSESISSMDKYFQGAKVCFVYLADVSCRFDAARLDASVAYEKDAPSTRLSSDTLEQFKTRRWFKRGWTLQEVIAPKSLRFYSRAWILLAQTIVPSNQ